MNENLNLVEILKDCPKGTKLYSPLVGKVEFDGFTDKFEYPIRISFDSGLNELELTKEGKFLIGEKDGECILFPSKENRDWSKWKCPNTKKPKFDPKTLQPFDRVLIKDVIWSVGIFSHYNKNACYYSCECVGGTITKYCIPYNDETKHLVGTSAEAPEYYRYWKD